MALLRLPQSNFTSGVLSKDRLRGRSDLKQYYNGASALHNVLIHPQGGVYRRPGTFLLKNYDVATAVRIVVFDYSEDIQYVLVFYTGSIDVWKNDVLVYTIAAAAFTATVINEFDWTQSANSMIIAHKSFALKQLVRGASDILWTLGTYATGIPLFAFTLTTTNPAGTVTPSAISGNITLTRSVAGFAATDVGGFVTGNGGEARITKFISTTIVEAAVTLPFINTTAIANLSWDLENGYEAAWSVTRGYPGAVCYHEDRLVVAGTALLPNYWWASAVGDFIDFDDTHTNADNAVSFSLRGDSINSIRKIISADNLIFLCNDSEHYVDGIITAELNFRVKRQDTRGVRKNVQPLYVDGVVMYADSQADVIREFAWDDIQAKYNTNNLNVLSGAIVNDPVTITYQRPKDDVDSDNVYVVNGDGSWATLNSMRKQGITGWTTGDTQGLLLYAENLRGTMYGIVERDVGGVGKKYFERFDPQYLMDCTIVYNGAPATVITGLGALEGKVVDILADGKIHEQRTVTLGQVTIDWASSVVEVGLLPPITVTPLPPNRELPDGTMIGEIRKIVSVNLGMTETFGIEVSGWGVKFLKFGAFQFGQLPPLFNGRKRVTTRGYSREPEVSITQNVPAGFHLTDIVMEVSV